MAPENVKHTRGTGKHMLWGKLDQLCQQNSNNFKEQLCASVHMQFVQKTSSYVVQWRIIGSEDCISWQWSYNVAFIYIKHSLKLSKTLISNHTHRELTSWASFIIPKDQNSAWHMYTGNSISSFFIRRIHVEYSVTRTFFLRTKQTKETTT